MSMEVALLGLEELRKVEDVMCKQLLNHTLKLSCNLDQLKISRRAGGGGPDKIRTFSRESSAHHQEYALEGKEHPRQQATTPYLATPEERT